MMRYCVLVLLSDFVGSTMVHMIGPRLVETEASARGWAGCLNAPLNKFSGCINR